MIPKIIHYCWFGGNPLPVSAKKCIASWHKYLPDYEIKEWNESNFDVNMIPYTAEAYKSKMYAFVSDYARFYILYMYGGLYFDTDVEVIRNIDDIIVKGPFMGCEGVPTGEANENAGPGVNLGVNPGLGLGTPPGLEFYKEILDIYNKKHFLKKNGMPGNDTVVHVTTRLLCEKGLKDISGVQYVDGIYIYPKEYFCPKDYVMGKLNITDNSRSIHHYSATWVPKIQLFEKKIWLFFGLSPHRYLWHLENLMRSILNYFHK